MKILVATDFSTRAQRAVRRAGLLARDAAAELCLVHVVHNDQPRRVVDLDKREAGRHLAEQIRAVKELDGVTCRPWVVLGDACEGILRAATALNADLIVMGAYRKQPLRWRSAASTVGRVVRAGQFPVLVVSGEPRTAYRRIIAAAGRSASSAHAIRTAASMPFIAREGFTVLHAYGPIGSNRLPMSGLHGAQLTDYLAAERRRVGDDLCAFLSAHKANPGRWALLVREGDAFEVINRAVRETRPDLLVLGTRQRAGFMRVLFGSVSEDVLRALDVDMLVVPRPARSRRGRLQTFGTPVTERLTEML